MRVVGGRENICFSSWLAETVGRDGGEEEEGPIMGWMARCLLAVFINLALHFTT